MLSYLAVKVLDRGRNTQRPVRHRSESVCAGMWAPPRAFSAWFRPVWEPIWATNRRFSDGFKQVFGAVGAVLGAVGAVGAVLAQPSARSDHGDDFADQSTVAVMSSHSEEATRREGTPVFFNIGFLGRPEIVDVWGLGGPGGPKNHSRR